MIRVKKRNDALFFEEVFDSKGRIIARDLQMTPQRYPELNLKDGKK